jgi:hypothetical protein
VDISAYNERKPVPKEGGEAGYTTAGNMKKPLEEAASRTCEFNLLFAIPSVNEASQAVATVRFFACAQKDTHELCDTQNNLFGQTTSISTRFEEDKPQN